MQRNLNHGRPSKSKLAGLVPEAILIRKQTGATWREIAAELSEREGMKIAYSSLYEVARTLIKRRRELDALPDFSARGRGVSPQTSISSSPDDFEEAPKKLIVKTRKNA